MSREYTISAGGITLANQPVTLIGIRPNTNCALEILHMWISQSANATSVQQRVECGLQVSTYPTVVAATPAKLKQGDPVSQITGGTALAAGTCGINASAEGAGAKSPIVQSAFNAVNGWDWQPTPDETIVLSPASASSFYLYLPVAALTLTNWAFGLVYKEIG